MFIRAALGHMVAVCFSATADLAVAAAIASVLVLVHMRRRHRLPEVHRRQGVVAAAAGR